MNKIDLTEYHLYRRFIYLNIVFPSVLFLFMLAIAIYLANNVDLRIEVKLLFFVISFLVIIIGWIRLVNKINKIKNSSVNFILKLILIKKGFISKSQIKKLTFQNDTNDSSGLLEININNSGKLQKSTPIIIYSIIIITSIYASYYLISKKSDFKTYFIPIISLIISSNSLIKYIVNINKVKLNISNNIININGRKIKITNKFSKINVYQELKLSGFHPCLIIVNGKEKIKIDYSPISGDKLLYILLYLQFKNGDTIYS